MFNNLSNNPTDSNINVVNFNNQSTHIDNNIISNVTNVNQIETYNTTTIKEEGYKKDINHASMMAYQGAKATATVAIGEYVTNETSTNDNLPLNTPYLEKLFDVKTNLYGFGASHKLGSTSDSKVEETFLPNKPNLTDNSIFEEKEKKIIIDRIVNKKEEKEDDNKTN